jgi:hypothetical protein
VTHHKIAAGVSLQAVPPVQDRTEAGQAMTVAGDADLVVAAPAGPAGRVRAQAAPQGPDVRVQRAARHMLRCGTSRGGSCHGWTEMTGCPIMA